MEMFYNFNTRQVVNPLDSITHFYVNPYEISSWKMLGLSGKVEGEECDIVIQQSTGLPIIILPVSLLNFKQIHVRLESNGNMVITNRLEKVTQRIYAKTTEQPNIIRIDTVLNM